MSRVSHQPLPATAGGRQTARTLSSGPVQPSRSVMKSFLRDSATHQFCYRLLQHGQIIFIPLSLQTSCLRRLVMPFTLFVGCHPDRDALVVKKGIPRLPRATFFFGGSRLTLRAGVASVSARSRPPPMRGATHQPLSAPSPAQTSRERGWLMLQKGGSQPNAPGGFGKLSIPRAS
jgi:hypothetical protein